MVNSNYNGPSVEVVQVSKFYNKQKVTALSEVSLQVNKGELFGLIGPDGAGKSSLFRILTTLLLPDRGSAKVEGLDVVESYAQIRKMIGYMPGKFSLYQDLTVIENLEFFATVFNTSIEENYELIKDIYVQIEPFKDRPAGKLSGGMKQKLALCCALIHQPHLLLLDEPTTGVDPVSRKEFWEMLKRLKEKGISIMVSTPYMDEAEMCDRVALIQNGKIMSIDTPLAITKAFPFQLYAFRVPNMYKLLQALTTDAQVNTSYTFGEYIHVTIKDNDVNGLIERLKYPMNEEIEYKTIEAGIEDCFMQLMKN
ncbi:MAG TPA: ABC transporter ATP-binding protein [Bacteroidia bacterium]